jgi:hypothetical protein
LWDYWNYEHVQYFDSFEHLVSLLNKADLHTISRDMQGWIARKADEVRVQIVSGLARVAGLLREPRITPSAYDYDSAYRAMWGCEPPSAELVVENLCGGFFKRLWTCPVLHRAFSLAVTRPAVLRFMLTNATARDAATVSTICTRMALESDDGCNEELLSLAQSQAEGFFAQPWVSLALERNASTEFGIDFEMPYSELGEKHVCVEYEWEDDLQQVTDNVCKQFMSELARIDAHFEVEPAGELSSESRDDEASLCRDSVFRRLHEFRAMGGPYRISYPSFQHHM